MTFIVFIISIVTSWKLAAQVTCFIISTQLNVGNHCANLLYDLPTSKRTFRCATQQWNSFDDTCVCVCSFNYGLSIWFFPPPPATPLLLVFSIIYWFLMAKTIQKFPTIFWKLQIVKDTNAHAYSAQPRCSFIYLF